MIRDSRIGRFLNALAGKGDAPSAKISVETFLDEIAERLNKFLLPKPSGSDAGKIPIANESGAYDLADAPSGFPDVTAEDNGKGMFVENGEWALKKVESVEEVNITGTSASITPVANTIYNCGELTSLTVNNPPTTGLYVIRFTSGSVQTAINGSSFKSIKGLEFIDNGVDLNTRYEIIVCDNFGVFTKWSLA